jgi:hypothetical protein
MAMAFCPPRPMPYPTVVMAFFQLGRGRMRIVFSSPSPFIQRHPIIAFLRRRTERECGASQRGQGGWILVIAHRGWTGARMVALYTTWYNFARINSAVRMSPAMACGLEQRLWDIGDIVKLVEEWEAAE